MSTPCEPRIVAAIADDGKVEEASAASSPSRVDTHDQLPKSVNQPLIFGATGGTRLFLIRSGPGKRASLEYKNGFTHGVSDNPFDDPDLQVGRVQAMMIAEGLRDKINSSHSKFMRQCGVSYAVDELQFFHDGTSKSVFTYEHVFAHYRSVKADGMKDKPTEVPCLQWIHEKAFNNVDKSVLKPVVLFASFETIQRLLEKARVRRENWLMGPVAGSLSVIDFPSDEDLPCMIHCLFDASLSRSLPGVWGNIARTTA